MPGKELDYRNGTPVEATNDEDDDVDEEGGDE